MASNIAVIEVDDVGVRGPKGAGVTDVTYLTRAAMISAMQQHTLPYWPGTIYTAAGLQYIAVDGATLIPDMPGFIPYGDIEVEHFGVVADLLMTLIPSYGYCRDGGTDQLAGFHAANAAAKMLKTGFFHARRGDYFINGNLFLTTELRMADFQNFLWTRYTAAMQGVTLIGSDAKLQLANIIGQYDREGLPKPGGGQQGSIVGAGPMWTDAPQSVVNRVGGEFRVCRAALKTTDGYNQTSNSSWAIFVNGWVENHRFKIGTHGFTNVNSNGFYIQHFGGWNPGGASPITPLVATYHAMGGNIEFTNEFRYSESRMGHIWECASTGETYFGPTMSFGSGGPFSIGIGDNGDKLAIPEHKGRVNKGIRAGHQTAFDITGQTDWSNYGIYIKGRGESKFFNYPGTSILEQVQDRYDIKVDGITMTVAAGSPPASSTGKPIFCEGILGDVDLGLIHVKGGYNTIERESGTGNVTYRVAGGDGICKQEYARGGRILGAHQSRGDDAGTSGISPDNPGYAAGNRCINITGQADVETTTTAAAAAGDTQIAITPLTIDVFTDDPIAYGTTFLTESRSRGMIKDGVPYLYVSPLLEAIPAGSPIRISKRALLDELDAEFESSQYGLRMAFATVYDANLSLVRFTGMSAARLSDQSTLFLKGSMPSDVGRMDPVSGNYTILLESGSRVFGSGMRIRTNNRVTAHVKADAADAKALFTNCQIQSLSKMFDAAMTLDQGRIVNCVNFSGLLLTRGSADWSPTVYVNDVLVSTGIGAIIATYTLVEDMVQLFFDITLTAALPSAANLTLRGLPYAPLSTGSGTGIAQILTGAALPAAGTVTCRATNSNGGDVAFYQQAVDNIVVIGGNHLGPASRIRGTVNYRRAMT